jgi:hypothetical protein
VNEGFVIQPRKKPSWARHAGILVAVVGLIAMALAGSGMVAGAAPAADDNAGTVQIDGTPVDQIPENTPHTSCSFTVEFRGLEADETTGFVTFQLQSPSGDDVLVDDSFALTPSGQGATSLSGSKSYTLTFPPTAVLQPDQGYHVLVLANTGEQHPQHNKRKVFWVRPCEDPTPIPVGTLGSMWLAIILGIALVLAQARTQRLERVH